jgi:hypothetical protein
MAVKIEQPEDERAKKVLEDPNRYFTEVRERVRKEVERELAQERGEA